MKLSKEFITDLRSIIDQALAEKNACDGKSVQDIVCEAVEERELSENDIDGMVCLTLDEARGLLEISRDYRMLLWARYQISPSVSGHQSFYTLQERIEGVEKKNESR